MCGSYAKTIGGQESESLRALTGAPSTVIDHKELSVDDLWEKIFPADKANFTMCCSCLDGTNGLVSSHAYTLVGCFEYKGNKLVKIRNPHGQGEWQGAWSDND